MESLTVPARVFPRFVFVDLSGTFPGLTYFDWSVRLSRVGSGTEFGGSECGPYDLTGGRTRRDKTLDESRLVGFTLVQLINEFWKVTKGE